MQQSVACKLWVRDTFATLASFAGYISQLEESVRWSSVTRSVFSALKLGSACLRRIHSMHLLLHCSHVRGTFEPKCWKISLWNEFSDCWVPRRLRETEPGGTCGRLKDLERISTCDNTSISRAVKHYNTSEYLASGAHVFVKAMRFATGLNLCIYWNYEHCMKNGPGQCLSTWMVCVFLRRYRCQFCITFGESSSAKSLCFGNTGLVTGIVWETHTPEPETKLGICHHCWEKTDKVTWMQRLQLAQGFIYLDVSWTQEAFLGWFWWGNGKIYGV